MALKADSLRQWEEQPNVSQAQCPRSQAVLLYVLIINILTVCSRRARILAHMVLDRIESLPTTQHLSPLREDINKQSCIFIAQGRCTVPWVLSDLLILKCFTQKYLIKSSICTKNHWLAYFKRILYLHTTI